MNSKCAISALVSLGVGLSLALTPSVASADHSAGHIIIEITDTGFNGKSGELALEVEQGQTVELTFVWAHKANLREEHIIVVPAYKLETEKLTATNRQATLKFIADKPGSFDFKCDLECDIHDHLQRGTLKVKRSGGADAVGSASALVATNLRLSSSAGVAGGGPVTVMAVLRDVRGAPVPRAEVRFLADTTFIGRSGKAEIGKAKTDPNGVIFFVYQPTIDTQKQTISAHFEGAGVYDESQQTVEIEVAGKVPAAYTEVPVGLSAVRTWAPRVLILVLLSIWSTFAYVAYQGSQIRRGA